MTGLVVAFLLGAIARELFRPRDRRKDHEPRLLTDGWEARCLWCQDVGCIQCGKNSFESTGIHRGACRWCGATRSECERVHADQTCCCWSHDGLPPSTRKALGMVLVNETPYCGCSSQARARNKFLGVSCERCRYRPIVPRPPPTLMPGEPERVKK